MLDEVQQQAIVKRLKRIEGQLREIRRRVQGPGRCVELLGELAAAEAALERLGLAILRYHARRCVPDGVKQGGAEQARRLTELVEMVDRFRR